MSLLYQIDLQPSSIRTTIYALFCASYSSYYPKATSKIIIRQNPMTTPDDASVLFPEKHSGISSEQTTATIAPAEKASAHGNNDPMAAAASAQAPPPHPNPAQTKSS